MIVLKTQNITRFQTVFLFSSVITSADDGLLLHLLALMSNLTQSAYALSCHNNSKVVKFLKGQVWVFSWIFHPKLNLLSWFL